MRVAERIAPLPRGVKRVPDDSAVPDDLVAGVMHAS
jgi:hypothetical protein